MIYNNVIWCNIIWFKSDRQRTQKHQILIRMVLITMFFFSIAQCFPPECENFCPYGRVRDSNGCQTCKCKPPSKSMVLFLYTSILKDSFIQPLLYCIYDSPWSQHEDFHVLWNYLYRWDTLSYMHTCIHGRWNRGGDAFFCLSFFLTSRSILSICF